MKKKKYLPLYYKWMESERIPGFGLCHSFARSGVSYVNDMEPLCPRGEEKKAYIANPWWGSGSTSPCWFRFTPFRQTILLFMAAMNNEL
jgi:hypothetical protein